LVGAAVGIAIAAGCGGGVRAALDRAALARQEDAYVRVVLALGVRDADSLDFYAGPAEWLRDARHAFIPLAAVRQRASRLAADFRRTPSSSADSDARRSFLADQLDAVKARVDILQGARPSFDDESRRLFRTEIGTRHEEEFAAVRAQLDRLIPGPGTLADRYAALERAFLVPPDRLEAVLTRAVDECRRATIARLVLPDDHGVSLEFVRGRPWSAFTTYLGDGRSRTEINRDFAFTVDRALDAACHETYPGHHAIGLVRDRRIQPLFSPESLRTEGAASFASALAFPPERRLAFERDTLMPLAGVDGGGAARYLEAAALVDRLRWLQADIARRYLDGRLEFARAAAALQDETLTPPDAVEPTLKFFNEFRTYVVTYTAGRDLVRGRVEAARDDAARWRAYRDWIGT
jgi:hypothetical protein